MGALRRRAGICFNELPGFLWGLRYRGRRPSPWLWIRNRRERLVAAPDGRGVRCDWRWTSELVAPQALPGLGMRLMRRCLADWPVELCTSPPAANAEEPQVSFIIGHRGEQRRPHLLLTLASLAAQRGTSFECLVVEQASRPALEGILPGWVRHVHTPPPQADMPYARGWAFNVGAGLARAPLLVFHDNDMIVPRDYVRELYARFSDGAEVLNLKRFVFYLSAAHSERILAARQILLDEPPGAVVQNLEAGGSVALSRRAFEAIGGFDESFVGWGGEDNELWDRAQGRVVYGFGYLPIVHLWHASQPEKDLGTETPGLRLFRERAREPVAERIARLRASPSGRLEGPVGEAGR